jgi:hypothetical protein
MAQLLLDNSSSSLLNHGCLSPGSKEVNFIYCSLPSLTTPLSHFPISLSLLTCSRVESSQLVEDANLTRMASSAPSKGSGGGCTISSAAASVPRVCSPAVVAGGWHGDRPNPLRRLSEARHTTPGTAQPRRAAQQRLSGSLRCPHLHRVTDVDLQRASTSLTALWRHPPESR